MYNYIKGIVECLSTNQVVIEANGVGYELIASSFCVQKLKVGEMAKIYTKLSVREDDMSLFGFYSEKEKDMFLKLTSVSGIGGKLAIQILSGVDVDTLINCIITENLKALNNIKGVGKKKVERIVLELKDKVSQDFDGEFIPNEVTTNVINEDVILALMAFDYTRQEAIRLCSGIDTEGKTLDQIVLLALKNA